MNWLQKLWRDVTGESFRKTEPAPEIQPAQQIPSRPVRFTAWEPIPGLSEKSPTLEKATREYEAEERQRNRDRITDDEDYIDDRHYHSGWK